VFEQLGYPVNPQPMAPRRDVIQAIQFSPKVNCLCKAIQQHSPIGSYLDPIPLRCQVTRASWLWLVARLLMYQSFSADGLCANPMSFFCQGGTHWTHVAITLEAAIQAVGSADIAFRETPASSLAEAAKVDLQGTNLTCL